MDQSRFESFLDDGWSLVGQLHVWLSKWPHSSRDQSSLVDLISQLQSAWGIAEDLEFHRIARICLALEQSMERLCARNLEFTIERLNDLANVVACLQDVLLGLEATREEPACDLMSIAVVERHQSLPVWVAPPEPELALAIREPDSLASEQLERFANEIVPLADSEQLPVVPTTDRETECDYVDRTLLVMLEEFVNKIDDTCHKLHVRMVADEAPYVSTTSRLEQLAQSTRELVSDIARQARANVATIPFDMARSIESPVTAAAAAAAAALPVNLEADGMEEAAKFPQPSEEEAAVATTESADRVHDIQEELDRAEESIQQIVVDTPIKPKRILIVEESLFFRHLIGLAVQSAGFDSCSAETVDQGMAYLHQSPDFHAILIGSVVSAEIAQAISMSRQMHGAKVIGLVATDSLERQSDDVDACVSRSNPIQLISKLNQILSESTDPLRKSA